VLALDGNSLQAYATMCFLYFDLKLPDAAILIGTQAIKRAEEIATGKFEDESIAQTVDRDRERASAKGKKGKKGDSSSDDTPKTAKESNVRGTGWTPDMKKQIAVVHNTLGLVALNKKSYKDAIPSFKKAVDLDPEQYEARLNLAAVSLRFRDYNTAEEQFKAVVAAQPRNYEAVIGLGVAQRGNRKYEEAEQQYLAAQKLDPSRPDSYFNLGLLYQEYKGSDRPILERAQQFYRDFLARAGSADPRMRKDAEKRIKDIDELFVALAEAAKLQKEAEEIQRKADEQQRKMEEETKRMQEQEKKGGGATPPAEAPAGPTTPPPATSSPTAPPPASAAPTLN
jgi:tetratricopeptide (TPR) repeat protein